MKIEDAQARSALLMQALGSGWKENLTCNDGSGWQVSAKSGNCTVSFNENGQRYEASVYLGIMFCGSSQEPVFALDVAIGKMNAHFARISKEHAAIVEIVAATYLAGEAVKS